MKIISYPPKEDWDELSKRPGIGKAYLENKVRDILDRVKAEKDKAVLYFSEKYDGAPGGDLKITYQEMSEADSQVSAELKSAIIKAKNNIEKFHSSQLYEQPPVETSNGVECWRKNIPVEKVGLYIPGGSSPLFSTLLMLGIPAKLAGCKDIVICTPAGKDGNISPVILYTANLLGLTEIYKVGGAQAIAAMAYGTETIKKVYKIFGPGNQYVTKAKELVQQEGIAIDMPAGPSEVLVIADKDADAGFIAADLLSQAEHGNDSQVLLLTDDNDLIGRVKTEVENQTELLSRKETVLKSLENSKLILLQSMDECIDLSNFYAPEHLIINTVDPGELAEKVTNAGSVFLGKYSCESMGDYASGTNHTLPTNGYARNYSGLSTESFIRKITFQKISREGILELGPSVEIMAEAESLDGHRNAVSIRLKNIGNG